MTERIAYKWIVAAVFVLGLFMNLLDLTIVNVALPTLSAEMGASITTIAWVSTAYLLAVAICTPLSGWLGDRFGSKRAFLTGLVIFTLGSLLCGLAWDTSSLIAFRAFQGVGGGLLIPVGSAMVLRAFPLEERARASALITVPAVVAPALGPVVGGYLVETYAWRWIFLVNVPIGVAGLLLAATSLRGGSVGVARRLDVPGLVLSATGLAAVLYALSRLSEGSLGDPFISLLGLTGIALLVTFIIWESRVSAPLIDVRLYRDRLFASGSLVLFLVQASFFGIVFLLPLLLQSQRGFSPLASGLVTFPTALGIMVVAPFTARLYGSIGPRRLVIAGASLAAVTALALSRLDLDASAWTLRALVFPMGVAFGLVFIPLRAVSYMRVAPESMGQATAAYSAVGQIGTGFGVALLATVLNSRLAHNDTFLGSPSSTGVTAAFHDTFIVAALLSLLGMTAALLISDRSIAGIRARKPDYAERPTSTHVEGKVPLR